MVSNDRWNCPGHGTVVQSSDNRLFMLYHAFNKNYDVFVGREGIIEELKQGADGWPVLSNATIANRPITDLDFFDDFKKDKKLNLVWQWPSKQQRPAMTFENGLRLSASADHHDLGTFLGQYIKSVDFDIIAEIEPLSASAGICLTGAIYKSKWPGEPGGIGIIATNNGYTVFSNLEGKYTVLRQLDKPLPGPVKLKMNISAGGKRIAFYYKDRASDWSKFHVMDFDAARYVPWGMGYRAGIVVHGNPSEQGIFNNFELRHH